MNNLGEKIEFLRKKNGYSLRKFGEICNLSHSYISDIEKGRTNPSLQTLQIIANKLNTSISYLIGESSDENYLIKGNVCEKRYYSNNKDSEIIEILNNNLEIKQNIYDLKKHPQKIDIYLKIWNLVNSIYKDIEEEKEK